MLIFNSYVSHYPKIQEKQLQTHGFRIQHDFMGKKCGKKTASFADLITKVTKGRHVQSIDNWLVVYLPLRKI